MSRQSRLRKTQRRYLETIAVALRPCTVVNARTSINNFICYLQGHHPRLSSFSELKRRHVEGWLRYLAQRQLKRSTRRNRIIKVRRFLETLQDLGWKETPQGDLFLRGDLPAEDKGLPKPLSHDTDQILQNELRERGEMIHQAILFMRATALRRQEMLDLKVDSLKSPSPEEWALHVPLGKLHDERIIPIDAESARIFKEILKLRGSPGPVKDPETGDPTHFLLIRPNGRRFSGDAFRYHLEKIEKEIGLREHPTPHRLRHTYATEMLRAGVSLPVLMKLLGHRSIGMTLRYAKVTGMDVRRAYVEAMEAIEKRYELPALPKKLRASDEKLNSWRSVASRLKVLASEIEGFRRDHSQGPERKKARRFIERLRRLAADFQSIEHIQS